MFVFALGFPDSQRWRMIRFLFFKKIWLFSRTSHSAKLSRNFISVNFKGRSSINRVYVTFVLTEMNKADTVPALGELTVQ